MIRPMCPAQASSPQHGPKHHHRQRKENAGNLKPHNPANPAKRLQKTPDPASRSACSLCCNLTRNLAGGTALRRTGRCSRCRLASRSLGSRGHALAGDASGDAESDTQCPADGLRLHFDLMVTARLPIPIPVLVFDRMRPVAGCSWAA